MSKQVYRWRPSSGLLCATCGGAKSTQAAVCRTCFAANRWREELEPANCVECGEPLPIRRDPRMTVHRECKGRYDYKRRRSLPSYLEASRKRQQARLRDPARRAILLGNSRTLRRQKRRRIRQQVLHAYGGACACCGERTNEFLAVDHIGGGGNKHRKALGKWGESFYRWLCDQGFPPGYRLLCHNCNFARGRYGYCPHEHAAAALVGD